MTKLLIFHNGGWHIARVGIFNDMANGVKGPPLLAWYDAQSEGLICLAGEEECGRDLDAPTASESHQYEEATNRGRTYGIEAQQHGTVTGRWSSKDGPKEQEPRKAKTQTVVEVFCDIISWAERMPHMELPEKLDIVTMKRLYGAQLGISDKQIRLYLALTWKASKDWITNGCDRCTGSRGALGHDEPCGSCPTWQPRIAEFRKKNRMKYGIGQNPEVPF